MGAQSCMHIINMMKFKINSKSFFWPTLQRRAARLWPHRFTWYVHQIAVRNILWAIHLRSMAVNLDTGRLCWTYWFKPLFVKLTLCYFTLKAMKSPTAGLRWLYTPQPCIHLLFTLKCRRWSWKNFWLLVSSKASVPTVWHPWNVWDSDKPHVTE